MTDNEITVAQDIQSQVRNALQGYLALDAISAHISPRGLELPTVMTLEQAQTLTMRIAERMLQDAIEVNLLHLILGQIINYSESRWGDTYSAWLDSTGLAYGTLANTAYVARKVDPSLWNENLSFTHHFAVAPLEPEDQRRWLSIADSEGLSANELRRQIQATADLADGRDPEEADIQRQLERIASRMKDKLSADRWAVIIGNGLLIPLAKVQLNGADGADTVYALGTVIDNLEQWRWDEFVDTTMLIEE